MIVRALVIAFAIWSMFIEDLFLPDISVWGATGITVGCSTDTGAIFSAGGFGEGFTDISSSFGGMDELIRFWKKSSSSGSNFDFLVDRLPSLRVLSVFFAFFFSHDKQVFTREENNEEGFSSLCTLLTLFMQDKDGSTVEEDENDYMEYSF